MVSSLGVRRVRIYQPGKTAMQSGRALTHEWIIEYEAETARRPEALMGWTSSGDTYNQVRLKFPTLENAVAFAKEKSWNYDVEQAHDRHVRPRSYVDNFRLTPQPIKDEKAG